MVLVQPKRLFLLAFTQLWESFSYYGMRVLLVLFLTSQLQYVEGDAFALYALYTTLVELGSFVGGFIGDKMLGQRGAIVCGGTIISIGHLCLTFSSSMPLFFLGLGCIICGATLFRANIKAMVGMLYGPDDPRREPGFTLFYTAINMGGFIAALLCGFAAHHFGWHIGFGIAAIGMLIGLSVFLFYTWHDHDSSASSKDLALFWPLALAFCGFFAYLLSHFDVSQKVFLPIACLSMIGLLIVLGRHMSFNQTMSITGILGLLIVYFSFEELMGSLLMVYSEHQVDRTLFGYEVPSSVLNATNPLVIIAVGPLLTYILNRFPLSLSIRLGISFLWMALAFLILYFTSATHSTTVLQIILSFAFIALGELFIAPSVFAYCSEKAPPHLNGLTMGVVTTAFAIASLLSGLLSQMTAYGGEGSISTLFMVITLISGAIFFAFIINSLRTSNTVN